MMTAFCVSLCVCRFYEYGLLPGVHFVTVDTAADVPAMVKYLRSRTGRGRRNSERANVGSHACGAGVLAFDFQWIQGTTTDAT